MEFKSPKLPNLLNLLQLSRLNTEPVRKIAAGLFKYKILISSFVFLVAFVAVAMWYRGYLLSKMKSASNNSSDSIFYSTKPDDTVPTIVLPTIPTANNNVLGTSNNNSTYNNTQLTMPTPFPTFPPLPTAVPIPIITMTPANTSPTNNNPGNSNCTTGSGVPNSWYSDVYPNPPVSTGNGSMTLIVYIRDCNESTAPVNDNLTVTLTSSDSTAKINGSSSPVNIQAQNGQVSFTVSSQNTVTDTFSIQDNTSNFTITDVNNHNLSVSFTNNNSGNSNCTTASGVPNFWYSGVSPASPASANTGSTVNFTVDIKDCSQTKVSSDNLTISQTSSDLSLTINGSSPPVNIQAQNGQATFTVSSQNAGTDNLTVQDTTSNFIVTDTNNHNPSIVFSGSSTATPTPTNSPSASLTPTSIPTSSNSPTPTPSNLPTSSPVP